MRIFISSTTNDLSAHRIAARDTIRDQGHDAANMENFDVDGRRGILETCHEEIDECDAVLAIIAFRKGGVPSLKKGGNGQDPYVKLEIEHALHHQPEEIPVFLLLADEKTVPIGDCDEGEDLEWIKNYRKSLDLPAKFFAWGTDSISLAAFQKLVLEILISIEKLHPSSEPSPVSHPAVRLRKNSLDTRFPKHPYPVLEPYVHPELLGGRQRELDSLRSLLDDGGASIIGFSASSGAGKSSLLRAGLVPTLRREGRPVALVSHPKDPRLAQELVEQLLERSEETAPMELLPDRFEPEEFAALLEEARRQSKSTPVLVLDQFEDLLGENADKEACAKLGLLLAATARPRPGEIKPPCRWVLAYRWEFHGPLTRWLGDVLREARERKEPGEERLPYDLTSEDRFKEYPLDPLGTPERGRQDSERAFEAFLDAIERPLKLRKEDGSLRYPISFANGGIQRVARWFADERLKQEAAPLVPELQVTLAHLMAASEGEPEIAVPETPDRPIAQALENHLRDTLDWIVREVNAGDQGLRSRMLVALRRLADPGSMRGESMDPAEFETTIGKGGKKAADRLHDSRARIVRKTDDGRYELSHDRMAEVVVRLFEEEAARDSMATLELFVSRSAADFGSSDPETTRKATQLGRERYRQISAAANTLLHTEERKAWWAACRSQRRQERWRRAGSVGLVLLVVGAMALGAAWTVLRRSDRAQCESWLSQPDERTKNRVEALVQLQKRFGVPVEDLREMLLEKEADDILGFVEEAIFDGVGQISEDLQPSGARVLVELALPLIAAEHDTNHQHVATLLWALDYWRPKSDEMAQEFASLREKLVAQLRKHHEDLPESIAEMNPWEKIEGGSFEMGSPPEEEGHEGDEKLHWVRVSTFEMQRHEVTLGEYRKFDPDFDPSQMGLHHPVVGVTWYEAYAYAAWLGNGARLPTESEWEYAARRKTTTRFWSGDTEEDLKRVGWYYGNYDGKPHEVCTAPENSSGEDDPWELCDMHGNVWEWVSDWYEEYPDAPTRDEAPMDPHGPNHGQRRVIRGGCFVISAEWARSASRSVGNPGFDYGFLGFRVVRPASPS